MTRNRTQSLAMALSLLVLPGALIACEDNRYVTGEADTSDVATTSNVTDPTSTTPDSGTNNVVCTENCGGGYACVEGSILACDQTAPCGQCSCATQIDVAACPVPCTDGDRSETVGALCGDDCACDDDSGCGPGELCQSCECVPDTQPDCGSVCEAREDRLDDSGQCEFEYLSEVPCETFCADLRASFSANTAAAFNLCIEVDPLCFSSIEDCIFGVIYGDNALTTVSMSASGYDEYDGMTVYGVIEDGARPVQRSRPVTIIDGGWTLAFEHSTPPYPEKNIYLYIDTNDDQRCDETIDVATFVMTMRGDDYENLTYEGELTPDGRSFDFVCDLLN